MLSLSLFLNGRLSAHEPLAIKGTPYISLEVDGEEATQSLGLSTWPRNSLEGKDRK